VGVYGAVRYGGLDEDARTEFLLPYAQIPWVDATAFVVRTRTDPLALADAVRAAIWSVDGELPVFDVRTMEHVVRDSGAVMLARLGAAALGFFGLVALLLAALGLYAVICYGVAQRTFEIGVRCALGADRRRVLGLVIGQGMFLVAVGLVLGFAGALAFARVLRSMLHGVSAVDPIAFGLAAATLVMVALLATLLPARRAAAIDPLTALRTE
jgi:ABC-type antimicrobial peptide transport system permease subunit